MFARAVTGSLLAGSLFLGSGCGDDAHKQLRDARREFRDVQKKLGEASREMEDVTQELAEAAEASQEDLARDWGEIARAAKQASDEVSTRAEQAQTKPLATEDRIRCEAGHCVVERSLLAQLRARPESLLKEGLVVPDAGPPAGLRLERLRPGGLGEQLGLKNGDVLTKINDQAVTSVEDLITFPSRNEPREELTLALSRGGEDLHVAIRLAPKSGAGK